MGSPTLLHLQRVSPAFYPHVIPVWLPQGPTEGNSAPGDKALEGERGRDCGQHDYYLQGSHQMIYNLSEARDQSIFINKSPNVLVDRPTGR